MLNRLMGRLTYANVTATVALFVALGGTSYAALKLPRNSVGPTQIRSGAVGSSELRDRSVRLQDISRSARRSLRGAIGPQGATGAPGPAGAAAIEHFAAVSASGGLVRGDAKSGGHLNAVGQYDVGFAESVSGCVYTASLGTTDATTAPAGRVTVNDLSGHVGVQTYDVAGSPADLPFQLLVAC